MTVRVLMGGGGGGRVVVEVSVAVEIAVSVVVSVAVSVLVSVDVCVEASVVVTVAVVVRVSVTVKFTVVRRSEGSGSTAVTLYTSCGSCAPAANECGIWEMNEVRPKSRVAERISVVLVRNECDLK